jgi:hypothetical protein
VSQAPFLNLSDLPDEQAMAVIAELIREQRKGVQQRPFGRTYIEMRRVVEDRLRRQFTALGRATGSPSRIRCGFRVPSILDDQHPTDVHGTPRQAARHNRLDAATLARKGQAWMPWGACLVSILPPYGRHTIPHQAG